MSVAGPAQSAVELSVVVPTYRRPALLERCLTALAAQDADPARFEVVVVDDGSGDATARSVDSVRPKLVNLELVRLPSNRGPATARNRGIGVAKGRLVLFLDDDVEATPTLLSTHLRLHEAAEGAPELGVLGRVDWHPSLRVTPFMRWLDRSGFQFAYETWLQEGPIDPPYAAFYTANLSMHRRLLLAAGGFDGRFPYANFEDVELAWRLAARGFRLHYRPGALAYHTRAIDLRTFKGRMGREAESAVLLRTIQPDFPLDEGDREAGYVRRRHRPRLWLAAAVARVKGDERVLGRYYRSEIAAAYRAGRRRRAGRPPATDPPS